MGRPLNKKYFGNRNVGSLSTHADDGIGGEGIASVTWASLGTFRTTPVGLALPAPTLPGGVQATMSFQYQVIAVSTGAGITGLELGDKFAAPSVTTGLIATVVNISGANAVFAIDAGNGGSAGDAFASIPGGTTVGVTLAKISGSGSATTFQADLDLHITDIAITEAGSGYNGSETFTVTVGAGDPPAGVIVLTTDSGPAGSATNQENAIIIRAKTTTGGTVQVGDIIKQVNDRAYKIKTADGTKQKCLLVESNTPAVGEAYIKATDANGNTYFVTKLTSRTATVVQWTQNGTNAWLFVPAMGTDGARAKWTFSGTPADDQVTIENA